MATAQSINGSGTDVHTVTKSIQSWNFLKFWELEAWFHLNNKIQKEPCFPAYRDIFRALELTAYNKVKVVVVGQDPYPTKGYAHGLAFSVQPHVYPIPRSLRNIFDEYKTDLGYGEPRNGDLSVWAERGVLLLNRTLTVEEGKPLSHEGIGWEKLSYEIIRSLVDKKVVFLLMGKKAQEFRGAIPESKVVCTAHPSPYSMKQFFGSRPFTAVNAKLRDLGVKEVDWRLP